MTKDRPGLGLIRPPKAKRGLTSALSSGLLSFPAALWLAPAVAPREGFAPPLVGGLPARRSWLLAACRCSVPGGGLGGSPLPPGPALRKERDAMLALGFPAESASRPSPHVSQRVGDSDTGAGPRRLRPSEPCMALAATRLSGGLFPDCVPRRGSCTGL
jgi:hypothetical protein